MSALVLKAPLYGLEPHTELTLDEVEGAVGLYSMSARDDYKVRLMVLDAAIHFPNYSPDVPAQGEHQLMVIVNGANGTPTVNLMAPLLVEGDRCRQVIVEGDFDLRAPLPRI